MNIVFKFTLVVLFLSLSFLVKAQSIKEIKKEIEGVCIIDENQNVSYQKIFETPGLSKDEIFTLIQSYFTYHYRDSKSVLKIEDKEKGIILAHGLYSAIRGSKNMPGASTGALHIIRADIKEGKVRIIITLTDYELPPSVIFGIIDKISITCPISPTFNNKKWWAHTFYRAHKRVLESFSEIEMVLKKTNTSKSIENNNW